MRYLILSDIHANWEALQAVLKNAEGGYDRILCLGDFVGYGPDPNLVVEWAREHVTFAVRGNHDRACTTGFGIEDFSPLARAAAVWTFRMLRPENSDYLRALPQGPQERDGFSLVHGSPRDEDEYLVADYEAATAFSYVQEGLTFFGHTHLQGGFESRTRRVRSIPTKGGDFTFEENGTYLVNPGSVGQPRDLNPAAAYALYTPGSGYVTFCRVPYEIEATQIKIRKAGLPALLADRLAIGK